ncbi:hypothetical protein GGP56_000962 [Salinibacter ruber]|nr:hypothetical protein [Salinibacter ruber]
MVGLDVIVVPGWAYKAGLADVERARKLRGPSPARKAVAVCAASYAHAHPQ